LVKVVLRNNESQQQLLRRFRKVVNHSGIKREVRKKRWFVSKNEQRRLDKKKAIRRLKQRERKSAAYGTRPRKR
jgi:small subunit ribosomal protein S21